MYRILFICTGNICRTPMAESLLRAKVLQEGLEALISVDSAGTWANEGLPPTELSVTVIQEAGLEPPVHRSKHVDSHLMQRADLVLCMGEHHKRDLQAIFPQHQDKIFTLREFNRHHPTSRASIEDPFGRNIDQYRKVFQIIRDEVERIWPEIKRRARAKAALSDQ
ncbi:MAG: low molecular weight protein arginine phosphatase [Calditrichaeota bacterium]|nr:MAG: low molecular weight protein arginine phosphatase [Calditrichota bacterium]